VTEAKARVTAAEAEVVSAGAAVKQAKADIVVAEAHLSASNTGLAGAQAGRTQAQARVKAAEAGLKLAKDGLDRKTALKKDGFATEEDFLAAQVGHEAALAALEEAKAGLEVAEAACQDAEARVTVSKAQMGQAGQKFEQAESHLVQANAQVALATAGIAGAESQSEAAGADTGRAEAAVREAEAGFGLAQDKLDKAKVKAGIEGKVVARHVSTGEWVNPGSPIARIVDDRTLKVRFTLPESEAGRVAVGMPARFSVKSYPGKTFEASIFFVSAQGDPSTRAVEVKARFKNDKGELRAGGYCRVAVGVATSPDSLVVPETAVLPTEEGFVAYVLDGEVARKRSVKPGLRSRGNVEVLDGLKAGETLVVRGAHSLADGMKVKVTAAAGAQETPAGTPGQPHIP
jgi:multidrug efflux system membrane fusion protein